MSSILNVTDIRKSYGGIQALAGCTMAFEEGAINGLIGPNGSGKTTLFNVISGYENADAGRVTFRDIDITHARADRIFELGLGRTFQITRIFPQLTVLENLHVASRRHGFLGHARSWNHPAERERATEVLDFVGLTPLALEPAGGLRAAEAARVRLHHGRQALGHPARRARRRRQPDPASRPGRPHPRPEQGGRHVRDRRT
jgi:neutral amino acid transport system ATP-binding protein